MEASEQLALWHLSSLMGYTVFPGHLVLAGDTRGQRSGDEWSSLLRHRNGPSAVSEARACTLLPRLWALLGWRCLHEQ